MDHLADPIMHIDLVPIEGLRTMRQHLLLGILLHSTVWRKNNKKRLNFHLIYFMERVVIFTKCGGILASPLVMWYELNRKLWNILLVFPVPSHANRKPTWRLWVWLAKFAWYDVTWKPPIYTAKLIFYQSPARHSDYIVIGHWRCSHHCYYMLTACSMVTDLPMAV